MERASGLSLQVLAPGVLGNDSMPTPEITVAAVVSGPAHGALTLNGDGSFSYTPLAGFGGTDSFAYSATDSSIDSTMTATVTITVGGPNLAPVASNGTLTTNEDTAKSGTFIAADADGNPLVYSIVRNGIIGTVTLTNPATGAFNYVPAANANGTDSFTFKVNDGTVDSNEATVSVTVNPVDDLSSTLVTSSNNPSLAGAPITLTATVLPLGAAGTVVFKDGALAINCDLGYSPNAPVATCKTSKLVLVKTYSITAVFTPSIPSIYTGSTSAAFSQTIIPSAVLSIQFITHEIQDNTSKPKVKEVPVANALVRVYRKRDGCPNGLIVSGQPKIWGKVFDGLDGYHAAGDTDSGCPVVKTGNYSAEGTTDSNGNVNIIVPPALNHPDTDYIVIGRTLDFDDTRTVSVMDPLYSEKTLDIVKAGTQKRVLLHQLRLFNGRRVPGRDIEEFGTYLAIVEPEYMDWASPEEQYPFVLIAEGDWGLETSMTPPEGFVADQPVLSTQVVDTVSALQFTLKDIGSDWTETGITHVITHKGEIRIRTSAVPMFNKQPNAANGDNAEKKDTQNVPREVTRPVLPSRIIAKLIGMLF
jgi:VCBS repeat-containing protein